MAVTTVSAAIEETQLTIFGFTCPKCKVEVSNPKIYASTISDKKGYFKFNKIIIPKVYTDICLSSIDANNATNTPTCIASPPPGNYRTNIGPILLPPTISTSNNTPQPLSDLISTGYTIPNSPVKVYLYKDQNRGPLYPKVAEAYSLPILSTISNENGNYSFNLPTLYASNFRLFTATEYENSLSPKSNTITYLLPTYKNIYFVFIPFLLIILLLFFLKKKHPRYLPMLYTKLWPKVIS